MTLQTITKEIDKRITYLKDKAEYYKQQQNTVEGLDSINRYKTKLKEVNTELDSLYKMRR